MPKIGQCPSNAYSNGAWSGIGGWPAGAGKSLIQAGTYISNRTNNEIRGFFEALSSAHPNSLKEFENFPIVSGDRVSSYVEWNAQGNDDGGADA